MKHFHMLMAFLTIGAFGYSSFCILNNKTVGRAYMAVTHTLYTLLVLTGGYMLYVLTKVAGQQYWAYAKITLLVVAIVGIVIARKSAGTNKNRAKIAIGVVAVSLLGILTLAFTKPMLA